MRVIVAEDSPPGLEAFAVKLLRLVVLMQPLKRERESTYGAKRIGMIVAAKDATARNSFTQQRLGAIVTPEEMIARRSILHHGQRQAVLLAQVIETDPKRFLVEFPGLGVFALLLETRAKDQEVENRLAMILLAKLTEVPQ